jgi:hypothetical protein
LKLIWKPHVTVAAVFDMDQHFLPVREPIDGVSVCNQADIRRESGRLRNPMLLRPAEDYLSGIRYPLSLLADTT